MKRHTFMSDGYYAISGEENFDDQDENYCGAAIDKLAYYEDLEEQGRLLVLPCKLGTKVYVIEDVGEWYDVPCGYENECESCSIDCRLYNQKYVVKKVVSPRIVCSVLDAQIIERELGKTVFFTYEEAEAAINT